MGRRLYTGHVNHRKTIVPEEEGEEEGESRLH